MKPFIKQAAVIAALALAGCAAQNSSTMSEKKSQPQAQAAATPAPAAVSPTASAPAAFPAGLTVNDTEMGTGAEAVAGKMVTVHYTGRLITGRKFDSSLDRGTPFNFRLGAGQVIKGWDLGVAGMKVGGKRQLTIAPELGYGAQDMGVIPPNSTLVFDVELLGVQ
jgi:FKBP-type peptidyl-prolyl cis-trans isomerase